MLIVGAMAVVHYAERNGAKRPWLVQLLARRKTKVAAVALANKNARMIWAMMARAVFSGAESSRIHTGAVF